MKLETMKTEGKMLIFYHLLQCCGSGFVGIRIDFGPLNPNPDPDPGVKNLQKWKSEEEKIHVLKCWMLSFDSEDGWLLCSL
jgi:hypothetical protein